MIQNKASVVESRHPKHLHNDESHIRESAYPCPLARNKPPIGPFANGSGQPITAQR